mmetsp:Transcript_26363/g.36766  ORF Transcript_26363/g.36766 Transcript_26363/m.36766 type:complete len:192 (-) Transcript_26363:285-860(-)|eukprot:CAMPEP_0184479388 /NCGR_PEP_ID=MMETSP0113_2-20130426/1134_1 /TAXON_ID=91329 /ORGANISM="Norrisiella sphaerica, Strain BC52" /LENGTH=191 /DNA_ID=CAMNT_0026857461 /DNA_START=191 /DNA_END=766 /DNA_ORIENTATION=+
MWAKVGHEDPGTFQNRKRTKPRQPGQASPNSPTPVPMDRGELASYGMYQTSNQRHFRSRPENKVPSNGASPRLHTAGKPTTGGFNRNVKKSGLIAAEEVRSKKGLVDRRFTHEDGLIERIPKVQNRIMNTKNTLEPPKADGAKTFRTSYNKFCKDYQQDDKIVDRSKAVRKERIAGGFGVQCSTNAPFGTQ